MEITEVIRGEEWLPSLPLHYLLYEAFGWTETQPRFAHLSLLLKPDGKGKLSKRDGDRLGFPVFPLQWINAEGEVSRGYREDGYFPEAFVNLLAMLGWNPGDDRELFSLEELVQAFSLERVVKSGARFNADKAKWYNKEYLRTKSVEDLTDLYIPVLESKGITITDEAQIPDFAGKTFSKDYVKRIVKLIQERATFVADFWDIASYLFIAPTSFVEKDAAKFWKEENYTLALQVADFILGFEGEFTKESLEGPLEEYIRSNEWPMGKVMNCLRLALVGASSGLGIADIVTLIGKEEFAKRIDFIKATL
jgi:glutamyl-tRNA synthetase